MQMDHKEEYKLYKTCQGWTEEEAIKEALWGVKLMFKDVHGKASITEQVAIEIDLLLGFNNIEHISEEQALKTSRNIINLIL